MTPELSRPVRADSIGAGGLALEIAAEAAECAALARRLGVPGVLSLSCRFRLEPLGSGVITARGRLRARLLRECVVSLETFEATHDERFRLRFVPSGAESDDPDPESDDEIPYDGGVIDLGEAAVEQLALGLDPYPRKPGAVLGQPDGDGTGGPFAPLAALRRSEGEA